MVTGEHIRTRRLAAGLTQEALARLAHVSVVTVARLESGRHEPSALTVAKLTAALDVVPSLAERARAKQSAA